MKVGLILISLLVCLALLTGPYIRWGIVAFFILNIFKKQQHPPKVGVVSKNFKVIVILQIKKKKV